MIEKKGRKGLLLTGFTMGKREKKKRGVTNLAEERRKKGGRSFIRPDCLRLGKTEGKERALPHPLTKKGGGPP